MHISDYMDSRLIFFLETSSRDETLFQLVHNIYQAGYLDQEEPFFQAVIDREKIVSTGIGMNVAFPHAKLPSP